MNFVPVATAHELWLICQFLGILLAVTVLVADRTGKCGHDGCRAVHEKLASLDREKRKFEDDKVKHRMWHQETFVKTCRVCTGAREEREDPPK
jgi:hypothetical protein